MGKTGVKPTKRIIFELYEDEMVVEFEGGITLVETLTALREAQAAALEQMLEGLDKERRSMLQ